MLCVQRALSDQDLIPLFFLFLLILLCSLSKMEETFKSYGRFINHSAFQDEIQVPGALELLRQ